MGGWARKLMLITPNGEVLPCHAAKIIPGLQFNNVKQHSLREIWENSAAFQKFRGQDWMQDPCKSCDRRSIDFGGCRCQALLLASDPAATDPVCSLSPNRPKVDTILANVNGSVNINAQVSSAALISQPAEIAATPLTRPDWLYRPNPA
jgi:PqqA peptide cyclase